VRPAAPIAISSRLSRLSAHPVPFFPWEKIGADIFTFNKRDYLLVVDYFSKFPFVVLLTDKSASSVMQCAKVAVRDLRCTTDIDCRQHAVLVATHA
jgi:hypothetical protein